MRCFYTFILVILLLTSSFSYARDYPSDVDLKTAYCIRVQQSLVDVLTPFSNLQELSGSYQEEVKKLNRMRSYLIPKMHHLKNEPLIVAAKNAEEDIADGEKSIKFCSKKYPNPPKLTSEHMVLYNSCVEEQDKIDIGFDARRARLGSCQETTWLPY